MYLQSVPYVFLSRLILSLRIFYHHRKSELSFKYNRLLLLLAQNSIAMLSWANPVRAFKNIYFCLFVCVRVRVYLSVCVCVCVCIYIYKLHIYFQLASWNWISDKNNLI